MPLMDLVASKVRPNLLPDRVRLRFIGHDKGMAGLHIEINAVLRPVGSKKFLPGIGCFFLSLKHIEVILIKTERVDDFLGRDAFALLIHREQKAEKIGGGQQQTNAQQHTAEKNSALLVMHDKTHGREEGHQDKEQGRGPPFSLYDEGIKEGEVPEICRMQSCIRHFNRLICHKTVTPPGKSWRVLNNAKNDELTQLRPL